MTINTGVKGTLAKLLATEDLVVEHRKCETAQFDVERRVLTLPVWDNASEDVYDMLVSHEVGHALFTPNEDWTSKIKVPHSFINVIEDARIEKLMKRKYAGLPKTFFKGYQELDGEDFFQVNDKGDLRDIQLIDRINLQFKVGNFTYIPFQDSEYEFVKRAEEVETFEEVMQLSKDIFDFMKQQWEEEQAEKAEEEQEEMLSMEGGQGGQQPDYLEEGEDLSEGKGNKAEDAEQTPDQEIINPNQPWDSLDTEAGQAPPTPATAQEPSKADVNTEASAPTPEQFKPEAETDNTFIQKVKDYVKHGGYEIEYVEIPRVNDLKDVIISEKEIQEELDTWFTDFQLTRQCNSSWSSDQNVENDQLSEALYTLGLADKEYEKFRKQSQPEVNYLVKEFEMRKSAQAYARAGVSRTGVLNTKILHQYKYNEDLFKKVTTLPDGKNHGMIFVLDWSGSMNHNLLDTVKQVCSLAWFCRKVQIPFKVYAFSNYRMSWGRKQMIMPEKMGNVDLNEGFCLMELLTSNGNNKTFEHNIKNFFRVGMSAGDYRLEDSNDLQENYNRFSYYHGRRLPNPPKFGLGSTPLMETVTVLHSVIPAFRKETGAEKISVSILSDGETAPCSYYCPRNFMGDVERYYSNSFNSRCQLRNRKTGRVYPHSYDIETSYNSFLSHLKESFPYVNLLGFRILSKGEGGSYFRQQSVRGYFKGSWEEASASYKKNRFFEMDNSGFDKLFILPSTNTTDDHSMEELDEGATKAQIRSAFKKMFKGKASNKRLLTSFSKTVA
tara:strand:+ start:9488 stop:11821 length:2334 start_codon:yes stop_codon:yes gene_type:complete